MKKIDLYNVLINPLITEKSNNSAEKHEQVVFKVLKSATKKDIKEAFELVFNAKVAKVSVLMVKGKVKKFSRFTGKRADWKKAYINLIPGQNFDLATTSQK
ncbi:MAG: 50S ribosomal protein L23 [Neisseriaceae bacterium]